MGNSIVGQSRGIACPRMTVNPVRRGTGPPRQVLLVSGSLDTLADMPSIRVNALLAYASRSSLTYNERKLASS